MAPSRKYGQCGDVTNKEMKAYRIYILNCRDGMSLWEKESRAAEAMLAGRKTKKKLGKVKIRKVRPTPS